MTLDKILEAIKDFDFTDFCKDNDFMLDNLLPHEEGLATFEGATKFVIDYPSLDYVIKIPFRGYNDYLGDEDPAYDIDPNHYVWEPFEGANNNNYKLSEWDYCEAESSTYNDIAHYENDYIKQFFAKTSRIECSIIDYPIYVQEKCELMQYPNRIPHAEVLTTQKIYEKTTKHHYTMDMRWFTLVREQYGEEILKELFQVLETYNIRDLHGENVGFRKNGGGLVIFDYSSYFD